MSDAIAWCDNNLNAGTVTGNEHKYDCPFCGASDKLWVNRNKEVFICYRCGEDGTVIRLAAYVLRITFKEARDILGSGAGNAIMAYESMIDSWIEYAEADEEEDDVEQPQHIAPEGLRWYAHDPQYQFELDIAAEGVSAIISRGFTAQHLIDFACGYFVGGRFDHRLMLPVYKDGVFVYFQAWDFAKRGDPKYKYMNPKNDEVPVGKSLLVYNLDRWAAADRLVVVEGVFNAWAVEQAGLPSVAVFGKSLSSAQLAQIIQHPASEIIIGLDPDAHEEAAHYTRLMRSYGKTARIATPPVGQDWNDLVVDKRKTHIAAAADPHWLF